MKSEYCLCLQVANDGIRSLLQLPDVGIPLSIPVSHAPSSSWAHIGILCSAFSLLQIFTLMEIHVTVKLQYQPKTDTCVTMNSYFLF